MNENDTPNDLAEILDGDWDCDTQGHDFDEDGKCIVCGEHDEDFEPEEPCRADGTPLFRSHRMTRNERLHGLADSGIDTWEEYDG